MGSMCGGGGDNVQKQTSEPSDYTKGYLTPGLDEAKALFGEGPSKYYEGSTVAGFSPETNNALTSLYDRGMTGGARRADSSYALNEFNKGNLMDLPALNSLRTIGGSNSFNLSPAVTNLGPMASAGPGTADRLLGRTGDIVTNGGNVGGFTNSRVGDLSTTGPNTLAQFRSDVGDIITGDAQANNPAFTSLGLTAGGKYLNGSPYLDATYGKMADQVSRAYRTGTSPAIDSAFARSSGALKSGAALNTRDQAEENLGKSLGDMAIGLYGGNYDAERARQEAASANLGNLFQSGLGLRTSAAATSAGQGTADASTRLAATGQIAGDMSGDIARRLAASNAVTGAESDDAAKKLAANAQIGSAYESGADRQIAATTAANNVYNAGRQQQLTALGLAPTYEEMGNADLRNALGAGQARDTQNQNVLNADIARWDYEQNAPWANLQRYLALVNGGSPGMSTSVTQSGGNPLAGVLSGAGGAGQLALAMKGLGLF